MERQRTPEDCYKVHLGVYTKLIRGDDPESPIKLGLEARVNGRSEGFPAHLIELCRPRAFFRDEPMVTEIDPRKTPGGVFVYRPVFLNNRHLGMFARIEARSEDGAARAGRRFTHCAVLFVEDKWEPKLLTWAAEMLFTRRHGNRCWGGPVTERDDRRTELKLPLLTRQVLDGIGSAMTVLPLARLDTGAFAVRGRMPDLSGLPDPQVAMADDVACFLDRNGYGVHGRWLSVALGIGPGVEGHGKGYFVRYDLRPEESPDPRPARLGFSDQTPPLIRLDTDPGATGTLVDWETLMPAPQRGVVRHSQFRAENLWPDQSCPTVQSSFSGPRDRTTDLVRSHVLAQDPDDGEVGFDFVDMDGAGMMPMVSRSPAETPLRFPVPRYLDTRDGDAAGSRTMDDVFDPAALGGIRPAFLNLVRRIRLLDPRGGFGTFHPTPDDPRIADAFRVMAMALVARSALADPDEVRPWTLQTLSHPPLPVMGLSSPVDRGGLLQIMLSRVLSHAGDDAIMAWIERHVRRENNLRIMKASRRLIDPGHRVFAPSERRVRDFFGWLAEVPYAAEITGDYDDASAQRCMANVDSIIKSAHNAFAAGISPPT